MSPAGDGDTAEMAAYMRRLIDEERDPAAPRATLRVGPYTAMLLIGALQQVTRDPDMPAGMRRAVRAAADQLKPLFTGTPGEEIIKRGEHPEWDQ